METEKVCLNIKLEGSKKRMKISDGRDECNVLLLSNCNNELQFENIKKIKDVKCRPLNINRDSDITEIGTGSYNIVYDIGGKVALRLNNSKMGENQLNNEMLGLYIQNLLSKSKKSGGFGCNYICKIDDFGLLAPTDGNVDEFKSLFGNTKGVYAFMERMDEDLFDKVGKTKSYTEEECKEVVKNILVALDCIHSKGYAHLDLKLENVMLKPNSMTDVRLIDFGFAKKIGNSAYEIVVNPYSIAFGSPGYLSPEMKDYRRGNGKSDIWALGVMMLEMLRLDKTLYYLHKDLKKYYNSKEEWTGWKDYKGIVFNPEKLKKHINILRTGYSTGNMFYNEKTKQVYSDTFIDFLFKLLTVELKNRPTAKQCLEHDWLNEDPLMGAREYAGEQEQINIEEDKLFNEALNAADAYGDDQKMFRRFGSTARNLNDDFEEVSTSDDSYEKLSLEQALGARNQTIMIGGSKKKDKKRSKGKKRSNKKRSYNRNKSGNRKKRSNIKRNNSKK